MPLGSRSTLRANTAFQGPKSACVHVRACVRVCASKKAQTGTPPHHHTTHPFSAALERRGGSGACWWSLPAAVSILLELKPKPTQRCVHVRVCVCVCAPPCVSLCLPSVPCPSVNLSFGAKPRICTHVHSHKTTACAATHDSSRVSNTEECTEQLLNATNQAGDDEQ